MWLSNGGVGFAAEEMMRGQGYYNDIVQGLAREESPGMSVWAKDDNGAAFHTYSKLWTVIEMLNGAYNYLDTIPKRPDEASVQWNRAWIRRHDQYDEE